jgi:MFS family permease
MNSLGIGKKMRCFRFFLVGQGVLGLGESMRLIAVTMLIYKLTDSGVSAAAGVIFSSLPSIFASPFAGVYGDKQREGRLLILIDIGRFVVTPLFLFARSSTHIYMLLILISVFDVFYNPSRRKYVLTSTGKDNGLAANSQLTGVGGAAYLIGPLLAGALTDSFGLAPAIIIAAVCCLFSGTMTIFSMLSLGGRRGIVLANLYENDVSAFRNGLKYCKNTPAIIELLLAGIIIGFCTISVNIAFYPFAFDVLKVTGKGWSLMITIFYGTNLLAMILTKHLDKRYGMRDGRLFYTCLILVSLIWFLHAGTINYALVLLFQFIEGLFSSIAGIIIAARFQMITGKEYMARVSSANDVVSSVGRMAGMGCTAYIISNYSHIYVFIICGFLLLSFAIIRRIRPRWIEDTSKRPSLS